MYDHKMVIRLATGLPRKGSLYSFLFLPLVVVIFVDASVARLLRCVQTFVEAQAESAAITAYPQCKIYLQ